MVTEDMVLPPAAPILRLEQVVTEIRLPHITATDRHLPIIDLLQPTAIVLRAAIAREQVQEALLPIALVEAQAQTEAAEEAMVVADVQVAAADAEEDN